MASSAALYLYSLFCLLLHGGLRASAQHYNYNDPPPSPGSLTNLGNQDSWTFPPPSYYRPPYPFSPGIDSFDNNRPPPTDSLPIDSLRKNPSKNTPFSTNQPARTLDKPSPTKATKLGGCKIGGLLAIGALAMTALCCCKKPKDKGKEETGKDGRKRSSKVGVEVEDKV
ncbi:hypothetical protein SAY86_018629 [Trapa natans]|uniref:Uncharacterized protein n=1 Tax=Trapa natans TaxID=22666 RepID=A0AAN7R1X0_TRANT|nr:hypothetical protein SAY86_018629 [Trapa natans]